MSIELKALCRLALIQNSDIAPGHLRKMASHCGGVSPTAHLAPFDNINANYADGGNGTYKYVLANLLKEDITSLSDMQQAEINECRKLGKVKAGDIIEACLAAGDASDAHEIGRVRTYDTVLGGARGTGDEVTPWIERQVHAVCED
jgi:hypothetical protein